MNKIAAALLLSAAGASAFVPSTGSMRATVASKAFADGMVGGEGPEPMPFVSGSSVNFDPAGFAEVRFILVQNAVDVYIDFIHSLNAGEIHVLTLLFMCMSLLPIYEMKLISCTNSVLLNGFHGTAKPNSSTAVLLCLPPLDSLHLKCSASLENNSLSRPSHA